MSVREHCPQHLDPDQWGEYLQRVCHARTSDNPRQSLSRLLSEASSLDLVDESPDVLELLVWGAGGQRMSQAMSVLADTDPSQAIQAVHKVLTA